ncbi:MAG TPA: hypothetical protein VFY52_02660 [Thermoleophilaceae bacterium]|nr:hypothetical protein [Thermoleophilaceae bacterium]
MSFVLELSVDGLTEEQGRAIAKACRDRGAWPIEFLPRRRRRLGVFRPKEGGPRLSMPDGLDGDRHLLTDDAEWDAIAWTMQPELLPALAEAIRVLAEKLPQGFALRATWVGSEVREVRVLSAGELIELVLASQLNEFTSYRVPPHPRDER